MAVWRVYGMLGPLLLGLNIDIWKTSVILGANNHRICHNPDHRLYNQELVLGRLLALICLTSASTLIPWSNARELKWREIFDLSSVVEAIEISWSDSIGPANNLLVDARHLLPLSEHQKFEGFSKCLNISKNFIDYREFFKKRGNTIAFSRFLYNCHGFSFEY